MIGRMMIETASRTSVRVPAVVTTAFVLAIVVVQGAQVSPPRMPRDARTWLDAVRTHVPGQRDAPVEQIAPWSKPELDAVLNALSREPGSERLRLVERALVLHADIAMLNRTPNGYNLPASWPPTARSASTTSTSTLFKDGQAVGIMFGTVHWGFARQLLGRAPAGDDRLRMARRFYRAAGSVLQLWGEYPELDAHLAAGRRALGDDAVMLLIEGTMRQ